MRALPAGTWPSPITAAGLARGGTSVSEVVADGDDVWWAESRPDEGGRVVIVRWRAGEVTDMTPPGSNVRTRVHEYGGGAWWVRDGVLFYVDFDDQRLRRVDEGGAPALLTPEPSAPRALRYADGRVTADGAWFVCVHERHGGDEPVNEIVAVATDGSMQVVPVASGADFYAAPRISPDGRRLVWIQWMHPSMPWDVTELWIADLEITPTTIAATAPRRLVGNGAEALQAPEWYDDDRLMVVTDRSEWWNLYAVDPATGALSPAATGDFEIVEPHWVFGGSRHTDGAYVMGDRHGDRLSVGIDLPYTSITSVRRSGEGVVFIGSSYTTSSEVVRVTGDRVEVLRPGRTIDVDAAFLPAPELISFPTSGGEVAHGLYYAPAHPDHELPPGERPPLLVYVHGGPTSSAHRHLVPGRGHRFWTSRGVGVVDVDYRGSTRYGRSYRRALLGNWCVIDVDDAVAAAQYLAERGDVDGDRLLIEGGSAGGTLVLLAVANHDVFAAGTNLFGVTDLAGLITDDHKFESRYTFGLVGPWPEAEADYAARSPINCVDRLSSPLLVLQGADDTVVPRRQSEAIVAALREKGLPVAYIVFDGEGHGFRGADTIVRWFEADLDFFSRILGFEPADSVEHIDIENFDG